MDGSQSIPVSIPEIESNARVTAGEIAELRMLIGWDRAENTFERVVRGSYSYYTAREAGRLIAFLNVISDGVGDALLSNVTIHPAFQRRGIGRAMVRRAIDELTRAGIQCIWVTHVPELSAFY